ncbi:MAG: transposase [Rhodobacteraceae bacterium]|nr:transposase [Marivita sp. XM-24bin2]MCR9107960.1 transposase [Paracoccaceae bacterium]
MCGNQRQSLKSGLGNQNPIEKSSHKSPTAADAMRALGAWFLFLPPYSSDLNPIETAFAKLKALIQRAAARSYDDLWHAVGHVCDLFTDEKYYGFFKAPFYDAA